MSLFAGVISLLMKNSAKTTLKTRKIFKDEYLELEDRWKYDNININDIKNEYYNTIILNNFFLKLTCLYLQFFDRFNEVGPLLVTSLSFSFLLCDFMQGAAMKLFLSISSFFLLT